MGPFTHQEVPISIRVAQATGILGAAYIAGNSSALTFMTIPSILQAPPQLAARQWKRMTTTAAQHGGASIAVLPAVFGFLAYTEGPKTNLFKYYTASAVLIASLVPYLMVVMNPLNDKLSAAASKYESADLSAKDIEAGVATDDTVHQLLDKWGTANLIRAAICGAAAVSGAMAVIRPLEVVEYAGFGLKSGADRMGL